MEPTQATTIAASIVACPPGCRGAVAFASARATGVSSRVRRFGKWTLGRLVCVESIK